MDVLLLVLPLNYLVLKEDAVIPSTKRKERRYSSKLNVEVYMCVVLIKCLQEQDGESHNSQYIYIYVRRY